MVRRIVVEAAMESTYLKISRNRKWRDVLDVLSAAAAVVVAALFIWGRWISPRPQGKGPEPPPPKTAISVAGLPSLGDRNQ